MDYLWQQAQIMAGVNKALADLEGDNTVSYDEDKPWGPPKVDYYCPKCRGVCSVPPEIFALGRCLCGTPINHEDSFDPTPGAINIESNFARPIKKPEVKLEDCIPAFADVVNHPPHYTQGGVECIDAIDAALGENYQPYYIGQVMKYVWRGPFKGNMIEDLKKAQWYLNRVIDKLTM